VSAIDRRDLLKALAASLPGAALVSACAAAPQLPKAAPGALGSPGANARQPGWAPSLFSAEQALTVEDVAEQLLPETDTPGAKSAGVPAYIENLAKDVFDDEERRDFLAGVDSLNEQARQAHGVVFPACTPEQQSLLLAALATRVARLQRAAGQSGHEPELDALAHFWLSLRELAIDGYCRSKLGATRLLNYDPIPGEYRGCVALESVGKTWAL
jgi:glucoside 3-dehydrogenase (cytochrome c) hitch-hiker subunit